MVDITVRALPGFFGVDVSTDASLTTSSTERRAARPHEDGDRSSATFWASTAAREKVFAGPGERAPITWHRPGETLLIEDPNEQCSWAVVSRKDLGTKRHDDFGSIEGIVMEVDVPGTQDTAP